MIVDVRKLSNGAGLARPVYQHGHFCVRTFHLFISYPGYSLFILFIIYLQIMDVILYFKIRSRDSLEASLSNKILNSTNHEHIVENFHIFHPLPIKKIMVESTVHFVRSPLAEMVETKLHFTYYFPFISANAISYFHCFLSLVSMKFLSSESLTRRRIGVLIFQFRTFLDCLDGVVFRAHAHKKHYKSYYGDFGYYVDAVSDILGGTCLILGCLFYFYKQRPVRTEVTATKQRSQIYSNSSTSDEGSEENDLMILNLEDDQSTSSRLTTASPSPPTKNDTNINSLETKQTIFITLFIFSVRYALAAMFWDRNVRSYESLLDSNVDTKQKMALQLSILHSPLTILIFYLWRYLCALSIQDYLSFSIFIDKPWEFVKNTSTIGWCTLLVTIFLTELHLEQTRSLFIAIGTL